MASSGQQSVTERRLRPIYEAIDNMQYKKAVQLCDKVLKKQTDLQAGKALKALALSRQQRVEEATALINQLMGEKPVDEGTLQAMTMYFRETGQLEKIPEIYEAAVKKKPKNDELLSHLFMAYVRTEDYKKQQQTALALHKVVPSNPYYSWAVMSIVMQAQQDPKMAKVMYLPLAEKMLDKFIKENRMTALAELRLLIMVLEMVDKPERVLRVLEGPLAKLYTSIEEKELKMLECWLKLSRWKDCARKYTDLILHNLDHWSYYVNYLNCQIKRHSTGEANNAGHSPIIEAKDFIRHNKSVEEAKKQGKYRAPFLAELEFICKLQEAKLEDVVDLDEPLDLLIDYFKKFGHKPCCFDDTHVFITKLLSTADADKYLGIVEESVTADPVDYDCNDDEIPLNISRITKHIYLFQLRRYLGKYDSLSIQDKLSLVDDLKQHHISGLKLGRLLWKTENQFSDFYIQLAAHILLEVYQETDNISFLWDTAIMLELGWKRSRSNAQIQLMLLKIYGELGAFEVCSELYDALEIKSIQIDTLGYLTSRYMQAVGTFLFANHFYSFALKFYKNCERESSECLVQAYRNGCFVKIPELTALHCRLNKSHHYALVMVDQQLLLLTSNTHSVTQAQKAYSSLLLSPQYENHIKDYFSSVVDNRDFDVFEDWHSPKRKISKDLIKVSFEAECLWLRILAVLIKLLKGAVFFVPVSHGDAASQSDGSSQNSELPPPPVTVKLTSIKVYKEDLALLEESVKDAKTHEAISAFKQFKNPMVPVSQPPSPLLNLFIKYQYGQTLISAFKITGLIHELTQSSTVDNEKLTEVKTLLDSVVSQLKESSIKIPGVPDEVRKQFKEMILSEKDSAPAGDAQPATAGSSDDTSNNEPAVSDKSLHPFDVLRKVSIQFEPYVMFVQVTGFVTMLCAVCAELLCPLCATPAAPAGAKKKRFKSTVLSPDIDKLLLDYIGQLKSIISELTARHPLLPNITDTAGFVESFSRLSVDDQETSDPEEHLAWLTSATHTFQEVVESYNSSLKSCGNILDSKRQLLDDTSVLLNHHLQSL